MTYSNLIVTALLVLSLPSCSKHRSERTVTENPSILHKSIAVIDRNGILTGITDLSAKSLVFPPEVKSVADMALAGTDLESVVFNEGLEKIGERAFRGSKIKSVTLPGTLNLIGDGAFEDCTCLVEADLSKSAILSIGDDTFRDSGLKNIYFLPDFRKYAASLFVGQ